jgi:hypothetical protein
MTPLDGSSPGPGFVFSSDEPLDDPCRRLYTRQSWGAPVVGGERCDGIDIWRELSGVPGRCQKKRLGSTAIRPEKK